ncbi:MAG: hypothetical protein ABIR68_02005, partial [Ilumatobacteraceae bacterium]
MSAVAAVPMAAHAAPAIPPVVSPDASLSTSGDYASDVLGDAWDFNNAEDIPAIPGVGCVGPTPRDCEISVANGQVTVFGIHGAVLRLVRNWGETLPWGRDGRVHPIDASRYTLLTLSNCGQSSMAVTFVNDAGEHGEVPFETGGCSGSPSVNMAQSPQWHGKIIEFNLHISNGIRQSFDWIRLRRPDAPVGPPGGVPVAKVLTPNADGGADYGSSIGNPWDMTDPGDVSSLVSINGQTGPGGFTGSNTTNDPGVVFPLPAPLNPDHYHRFSADLYLDGAFGLEDTAGAGMNARIVYATGDGDVTESQDIVVVPGWQHI